MADALDIASPITVDGEPETPRPHTDSPYPNNEDNVSIASSLDISAAVDTTPAMDKQVRMSECRTALTELVEWKRENWHRAARFSRLLDASDTTQASFRSEGPKQPPCEWLPKGQLVARLHEHNCAVQRLVVHPEGRLFMSAGRDGLLKLWDSQKMEGIGMVNRSQLTYTRMGGKIRSLAFFADGDRVACSADHKSVKVINVHRMGQHMKKLKHEQKSGRQQPSPVQASSSVDYSQVLTTPSNLDEEGPILEMDTWSDGFGDLVMGLSHHGYLLCWDLRAPGGSASDGSGAGAYPSGAAQGGCNPVWRRQCPSRHGLVTAFCVDDWRQHWACVGTNLGMLITWDLRFQLPVNHTFHSSQREQRVVRLWADPDHSRGQSSRVWCSVAGNGEMYLYDLEASGSRVCSLWSSDQPPLSYSKTSNVDTTAALISSDSSRPYVITGDTAGSLRFWNLRNARDSYPISYRNMDSAGRGTAGPDRKDGRLYKTQNVDGVDVFIEQRLERKKHATGSSSGNVAGSPADLQVTTWHKDIISDVITCYTGSQWLMVSSSRDGVINVWQ